MDLHQRRVGSGRGEDGGGSGTRTRRIVDQVKRLDMYPKTPDTSDAHVTTVGGSIMSLLVAAVAIMLLASAVWDYASIERSETIGAPPMRRDVINMDVHLAIDFPELACNDLTFEVIDDGGLTLPSTGINKLSVDPEWLSDPRSRRNLWTASGQRGGDKPGCRVAGTASVPSGKASFHVAYGTPRTEHHGGHHHHVHLIDKESIGRYNCSHTVQLLTFGRTFPGHRSTLAGVKKTDAAGGSPSQYLYYVGLVPIVYRYADGSQVESFQYSAYEHRKAVDLRARDEDMVLPGVFFKYDVSEFVVQYAEHRRSLTALLVRICAIVGGMYVVFGLLSRLLDFIAVHRNWRSWTAEAGRLLG